MAIYKNTPPIVTNGLVLNLDAGSRMSYLGSGTTWSDLSGGGNNGTLVNSPAFNSADQGSIVFDGTNDYTSFTANPTLTNQITVEIWVKMDTTTPNTIGWILGRELSYRLVYNSSAFSWTCATVNNAWYTAGTDISTTTSVINTVYQVICTYDGTNNRMYINGRLRSTGAAISGNILNTGTYYLVRSDSANVDYGKGILYSHRIYNRALSAAEVAQNYNALKSRFGLT